MDETADTTASGSDHRRRRSHKKSRNGCTKCKGRRIKCDESKPRCSRCEKMNLSCQYPQASDEHWTDLIRPILEGFEVSGSDRRASSPDSCHLSPATSGSPLSSTSGPHSNRSLLGVPIFDRRSASPLPSHLTPSLTSTEFALLQHYLEHTSKDLTVDDEDQYTLQVGIPKLACQSKPLMRSVLAIAAVCKCCDIIAQSSGSHDDRGRVLELMALAQKYHQESLHEIQAAIPVAKQYDHVLANAAMMGMYGSGSQCVRIWLAKTAAFGDPPLGDFAPKQAQWIRLFRAARLAYGGLLSSSHRADDMDRYNPDRSSFDLASMGSLQIQCEYKVSPRLEPHKPATNHVLFPILAATAGSALVKLNEVAREVAITPTSCELSGYPCDPDMLPAECVDPQLQICFEALELLTSIVSEAFRASDSWPSTLDLGNFGLEVEIEPLGHLSDVSHWLRRYIASITSVIPSRLPRRFIMAFIHKVPTAFLDLVEQVIGHAQHDELAGSEMTWSTMQSTLQVPSLAHQLALNIYAHWTVLVMLLDDVWWIGGIGAWELRRIVSLRKDVRYSACLWNIDEDWWPESMFEINRHLGKFKTKS
ncbi:hypothetical protein BX600DRAFT_548653 [Xylariales sp. PMI_506]|nr:hypothetical protein BX600DRAFT_548653 [Xylariales sp. PMI_506]